MNQSRILQQPGKCAVFCLCLATAAILATAVHANDKLVRHPAPSRLVAIGDWHGDLDAARRSLRIAGAIDSLGHWCGGDLVVVQTGDLLDRGDQEQDILDWVERLSEEAAATGGAVYILLGNHELMNVAGDFRYVTDGGWEDFADAGIMVDTTDTLVMALEPGQRARAEAFFPGGPYARQLAERYVVMIIGRTLFVHGGILPAHIAYGLQRINRETQAWLRGEAHKPDWLKQHNSPIWDRHFSDEPDLYDCMMLDQVLDYLDCDRMVVGHTVQDDGITPHCEDGVWCIDTGAAAHYGGSVQVLEITNEGIKVLR
jgi:hypothetical protein